MLVYGHCIVEVVPFVLVIEFNAVMDRLSTCRAGRNRTELGRASNKLDGAAARGTAARPCTNDDGGAIRDCSHRAGVALGCLALDHVDQ